MKTLTVGSRDSLLALTQTEHVMAELKAAWPGLETRLKTFKTQGDLFLETSLSQVGDKGLFVKELEVALLNGDIDLAVHSLKDMPGQMPPGLALQSVGAREDVRDVLLSKGNVRFEELPPGSVVGTSSLRRTAQLRRLRPDLLYEVIRGNLQTRYYKLTEGPYQAIVLAAAGVHRLGWHDRIVQYFDPCRENIPAVGQGILAVEFRENDAETREMLSKLLRPEVETAMRAERAVLKTLEGGCQTPMGAYARPNGQPEAFTLTAVLLERDGDGVLWEERVFPTEQAESAGADAAHALVANGGNVFLEKAKAHATP